MHYTYILQGVPKLGALHFCVTGVSFFNYFKAKVTLKDLFKTDRFTYFDSMVLIINCQSAHKAVKYSCILICVCMIVTIYPSIWNVLQYLHSAQK